MKKCVVICSGGMDSVTLLHKLKHDGYQCHVLSFNYGQRHSKELVMAKINSQNLKFHHKTVTLPITHLISNSALTGTGEVPFGHYADENMKKTVVPNRNMIMLSLAIGYAINLNIDEVYYGAHAGDHAIYPDCRKEFIEAINTVAKLCHYYKIKVKTPFINLDKYGILKIGYKIGVNYAKTWTCYVGHDRPCGRCGSCVERAEAFQKVNKKDPLL